MMSAGRITAAGLLLINIYLVSGELKLQESAPSGMASAPGPATSSGCAPATSSILFLQKADNVTITPETADLTDVTLTLHWVGQTTSFFSNTPDQYAGRLGTNEFADFWRTNESDWIPNAALTGVGPLGKERTLIVTLKGAPQYDSASRTLTYNASIILRNTTMDDSSDAIKSTSLVNNMARGLQDFLLTQEEAHLALPSLTLTGADLFIDNIGGCVGWNGIWVHAGVCGRTGGWGGWGGGVCAGWHGMWVGGVWCA